MQFAAYYDRDGGPLMVLVEGEMTAEMAARFPKSFGFHKRVGKLAGIMWKLKADGVVGEKNETALKRLARLLDTIPECYGGRAANVMPIEEAKKLVRG